MTCSAPRRRASRNAFGRVQHVGAAHQRRQAAIETLLLLGDLLHVVAFAKGRLVAVDVIDADPVGGGCQRAGKRLQGARADRGDDGRRLAILPFQRRGRMGHGHLVAAVDGAGDALLLVDAQHLAKIGRAVPEDRQILADPWRRRPSTRASDRVMSTRLASAARERLAQPAGTAMARARARMADDASDSWVIQHRAVSPFSAGRGYARVLPMNWNRMIRIGQAEEDHRRRRLIEDIQMALRQDQRGAELPLQRRAEHQAENDRRHRNARPHQKIAEQADADHDIDVDEGVADRERADHAQDRDEYRENMLWHLEHTDEGPDAEILEQQQHHIGDDDRQIDRDRPPPGSR
jgi:hypothetical protein